MSALTPFERSILHYVRQVWETDGNTPTLQQIALRFGIESEAVVRRHLSFLQESGYLVFDHAESCGIRIWTPWADSPNAANVPVLGTISCGVAAETAEETNGYIPVSLEELGIRESRFLFAVEARGDSMIGRHIVEGDYIVLDKNRVPKSGDVVAALIGTESTLKTFIREDGKTFLRPENPKYDDIFPAEEAIIQGVMVMLIRKPR